MKGNEGFDVINNLFTNLNIKIILWLDAKLHREINVIKQEWGFNLPK